MTKEVLETIKQAERVYERARRYGLDAHKTGSGAFKGMCPTGHGSQSQACCAFNEDFFFCHHCHEHGDLIKLVELSEKVDFIEAVTLLARSAGIDIGLDDKRISKAPTRVFEVLTAATDFFEKQLLDDPEAQEQFRRYGYDSETLRKHKLGYAPGVGLMQYLRAMGFSEEEYIGSGLFVRVSGGYSEFFCRRLIFPYTLDGITRYMAGRQTPRTPDKPWESNRKYKKLPTFHESKRPYISAEIKNRVLFNQGAAEKGKYVIITEGLADCISLDQHGFHAVSPATTRFSNQDHASALSLLRRDQIIYICNDNELNNAGGKGATAMARVLTMNGYTVKMMKIPLTEKHLYARAEYKRLKDQIEAARKTSEAGSQ